MSTSVLTICDCGRFKFWLSDDGTETKNPCPGCGARYKGEYNPKILSIDKIRIDSPRKGGEL